LGDYVKLVTNRARRGWWTLSTKALERLEQLKGHPVSPMSWDWHLNDRDLVQVVGELGPEANGENSRLVILDSEQAFKQCTEDEGENN
jgi:hypothetical protein